MHRAGNFDYVEASATQSLHQSGIFPLLFGCKAVRLQGQVAYPPGSDLVPCEYLIFAPFAIDLEEVTAVDGAGGKNAVEAVGPGLNDGDIVDSVENEIGAQQFAAVGCGFDSINPARFCRGGNGKLSDSSTDIDHNIVFL